MNAVNNTVDVDVDVLDVQVLGYAITTLILHMEKLCYE